MAKKLEVKVSESETVVVPLSKKAVLPLLTSDFGRGDLNELRDAVNALLEAHNSA